MAIGPPALSLRHVTAAFGGLRAVDDVSFDVPGDAIVSLIGPNGAGKTTLLNCISGFVRFEGTIVYGDVELGRLPAQRRAPLGIGRTFQNLQLFDDLSLVDNVTVGQHSRLEGNVVLEMLRLPVLQQERRARNRSEAILRELDLLHYAERRVDELPFGVQKLAGVARALAASPRLLLLDEPAAGLNHAEVASLMRLLRGLRELHSLTVLLVEHNMRLVMGVSDHVVVLEQGHLLTQGAPQDVQSDPRVIEAYLGQGNSRIVEEMRDDLVDGR